MIAASSIAGAPPLPTSRLVAVELRKMFDTRSGFWMLVSIGALSLVATAAVIVAAPQDAVTYETFARAIGLPTSVILPMIAILAVTSEWSQRTGLTTFTLVPSRGRLIGVKAVAIIGVGVVSILGALAVGALGNLVGAAVVGIEPVWDVAPSTLPQVVLGNLVGMAVGFAIGVVLRTSAGALVAYFVVSFVLPGVLEVLARVHAPFADLQPWVDWNHTQVRLFEGAMETGRDWAMLTTTTAIWIVVPLAVGLRFLGRAEIR